MRSPRVLLLAVLLTGLGLLAGAALAPASPALAQDGGTTEPQPVPSPGTPTPTGTPAPPQVINHYLRFENSILEDAIVGITSHLANGLNAEAEQAYGNALDKLVFDSVYGIAAPPGDNYAATTLLQQVKPGWDAALTLALALMPLVLALLAVDKLRRSMLSTLTWAELKEAVGEWFLAGAGAAVSFYALSLAHAISKWFAVWIFSLDFSGGRGNAALTGMNLAGAFFFASVLGGVAPTVIVYLVFFALFLGAAILISLILAVAAYIAMMALLTLVAPLVIVLGVLPPLSWLRDLWLKGTIMALLVPVVNVTLLKLSYGIATNIGLDSIGGYIARAATLAGAISILLSINFKAGQILFGAITVVHDEMRATLTGLGTLAVGAVALVASAGTLAPGLLGAGAAPGGASAAMAGATTAGAATAGSAATGSAATASTASGAGAASAGEGAAGASTLSMNGHNSGDIAAATRSTPRARENGSSPTAQSDRSARTTAPQDSSSTMSHPNGANGSVMDTGVAVNGNGASSHATSVSPATAEPGDGLDQRGDTPSGRSDSTQRDAAPQDGARSTTSRDATAMSNTPVTASHVSGALAAARQARATQLVRAAGRLLAHTGNPTLRALGSGLAAGAEMAQAQHHYEAALEHEQPASSDRATPDHTTQAHDLGTPHGKLSERRAEWAVASRIADGSESPPPPTDAHPAPAWYAGMLSRSLRASGQDHDLHDALDVTHQATDGLRQAPLDRDQRAQAGARLVALYQNPRIGANPERFKQAHVAWAQRYQVTLGPDFAGVADRLFSGRGATPTQEAP